MQLYLADTLARIWADCDPFEKAEQLQGEVYRSLDGRTTLRFELEGRGYFIKIHRGIGVAEILKNLVRLRAPVLGADNEWKGINRLHELGIATMTAAGFGSRGFNPARRLSFLVTEALEPSRSLEEYFSDEQLASIGIAERRRLIRKLATITRTLHQNGINHCDYYLCHFLLDESDQYAGVPPSQRPIYLIDLPRMQMRKHLPRRWRIKDLASLCYSARQVGFTTRDELCFIAAYEDENLSEAYGRAIRQWDQVKAKASALYQKGVKKGYHP